MNIFDAARPDPLELEAMRPETWDMLALTDVQAEADKMRVELDQARSRITTLETQLAELSRQSRVC
jgi:septum formation topological specificity factor MinE